MLNESQLFILRCHCVTCSFSERFFMRLGFIGNLVVPKSIDSGRTGPLGRGSVNRRRPATLFAVQHSVMARPWFKRGWTRLCRSRPSAAPMCCSLLWR